MTSQSALGGGQAWINWLLATGFVVFVFTFQTGYAVTSVGMKEDLGLTVAQVGLIGSIYTWAFAVAQFVSGSILDRFGIRWVLPIAAALVSVGGLVFANAEGPKVLVLGQVLMALGASFGFVGAGFTGGAWFGMVKYGIMFCWVQFVASLSAIIGQRVLGDLVTDFAWNQLLNGMAAGGLALTVVMFLVMRNPARDDQELIPWNGLRNFLHDVTHAINEVAAIRDSWINALIGGATFGTMLALGVVWGPKYLMAAGMEQTDAFFTSSMMWAGLAFGAPAWGWISNKMKSRKRPMFIGCLLQFATIVLVLLQPGMSTMEANVYFFIWGWMAGASMLNFPIGAELVRPALIGTSAAVVNAVQFIVGGIIMAIPGSVLSGSGPIARMAGIDGTSAGTVSDYQWAMLINPLVLGAALVLFMFLRETYPKDT
ncbi:MFS transporter [Pseudomonas chengduensis]|nr:MFS transporter [Pseudomonas chengduensis]MDH1865929.1 MFS transporter [Pseudomonas chengduensis]